MTAVAQAFLDSFERLSERDQHDVAAEILRRVMHADLPPLDDEALSEIAAMTFRDLDAREERWKCT